MKTTKIIAKKYLGSIPKYFFLLSEQDKNGYNSLRLSFNPVKVGKNKNKNNDSLESMLLAIRMYAERFDENDWRRYLVCGVCWLENAIAINTRQLRILISKCKSSINGSLQRIGYFTKTSHAESWKVLFPKIPLLKDNFHELRQWTIRYKLSEEEQKQTQIITLPPISSLDIGKIPQLTDKDIVPIKFRSKLREKSVDFQ